MRVSEELMKWALAKTAGNEAQAREVVALLDQLRKINEAKYANEKAKQVAHETHKKTLQEISDRDYMNQQKCAHPTHSYHADASGNNDSYNECNTCGHVW